MNKNTPTPRAGMGLVAVFGSTFIELVGYFMLSPMLLLRLKSADVSTTLAGLYVATGWLGIFVMTPFASSVANRIGQRQCLWMAGVLLSVCAGGYAWTQALWIWFLLNLLSGVAMSLRWVLAEALIAEFCPPTQRGRYVGLFQTLISATFIIGPATMAWLGPYDPRTMQLVLALAIAGLAWTFLIPPVPHARDTHSARVGVSGLMHALRAHPIIMLAGFVGGFFETGVTSILPLYGLSLQMRPSAAAGLVAISGLGGMLLMIPAGLWADRYQDQAHGRRQLMLFCACAMLLATCALPWVAQATWLSGPVVFLWGGAGASLYGLSMTDIGSREKGITLVNSTAVLVLTYTLGGLIASALSAALIDWSPGVAFPAVLMLVAALGLWALLRSRHAAAL
jgi:MFS family permease